MSTIARTAAGTPVASTTTGGLGGPAHARARGDGLLAARPPQRGRSHDGAELEPGLLQVDHQHLRRALEREQAHALADRARAQDHHVLARLEPGPVERPDGDRHRLGHRRHRRVVGGHGGHLLLSGGQKLLKPHALPIPQLRAAAGAERDDRPRHLVSLHPRELRAARPLGQLARIEVKVRAADTHRLGAQDHLAGGGLGGPRPLAHGDLPHVFGHHR
jgi:hypothetical protein